MLTGVRRGGAALYKRPGAAAAQGWRPCKRGAYNRLGGGMRCMAYKTLQMQHFTTESCILYSSGD